ncbi:MAG: hypothetical protein ACK5KM_07755 [Hyphomicrobiaceae bacterium]
MTTHPFITDLESVALDAQRAEVAFRRNIASEVTRHERERQFAFRRVHLAERMTIAAQGSENEEDAVARQAASLRSIFGWVGENQDRVRVVEAWENVARSIWSAMEQRVSQAGQTGQDVRNAMLTFEHWYEEEFGSPFLAMLDQEIEEMPVVEF